MTQHASLDTATADEQTGAERDGGQASSPGRGTERRRPSLFGALEIAGLPILLLILIVWFSVDSQTSDVFTSSTNIKNILGDQAIVGLVAIAMVPALVCGRFDLSIAANVAVTNMVIASAMGNHGWPAALAILFGVVIGLGVGAVNGFLVAVLRLNSFIVTFGTYVLLGGIEQWYTKGIQIVGLPDSFGQWGSSDWLGIPRPFWLLIVVAGIVWYVLSQRPFGRYLEGIGSNESAARLVGINVDRQLFLVFVLGGGLAGVAGALLTSRFAGAVPGAGSSYLFPAFAAVFLGATCIRPGRYNVWGTIIGVYFLAVAVSGLTLKGAADWVQPVFNGAALIVAVALSTLSKRYQEAREARRSAAAFSAAEARGASPDQQT